MDIVVDDLPDDGKRLHGTTPLDLIARETDEDVSVPDGAAYDLWISKLGSTVNIEGSLDAIVRVGCSRCAAPVRISVHREFKAVFVTADSGEADRAVELDERDLDLDYYRGGVIDGLRLLAEQILLDIPMKILCADDCKGLCPSCGANFNQTECDCEAPTDPRWESLKDLRDRF